ncbi:hypothetical protein MTO96_001139 [Rhipicephalus appendiculatus]
MGSNFTIQKALDLAREEERVDRALLHFSSVQVDAVSSRPVQDGAGMASTAGMTAGASSPTGCADTSTPALPTARAGACYRCGSTQHWANSAACPGAGRARAADGAGTSRESAALRLSRRLVVKAHRRVTTFD